MKEVGDRQKTLLLHPVAIRMYALGYRITETVLGPLRNTDQPILSYVWRAWLIAEAPRLAILPLMILGALIFGLGSSVEPGLSERLVWGLIIAPWTETLVMWPIL
jgi:hypothetical protein